MILIRIGVTTNYVALEQRIQVRIPNRLRKTNSITDAPLFRLS
jgi:hypothetical protein